MKQLEIKELQPLIIDWAKKRNLNAPDKQYLKVLEEIGETAKAILRNDINEIKDGIGDIAVTIIIYYYQLKKELIIETSYEGDNLTDKRIFQFLNLCLCKQGNQALFYLIDLASKHNTTLKECLNLAWNEIKNREGKTINGTFIKD